ncbi:nitroreductase family protein [Mucilaginibacter sp.]|uniref:nitroreductase family protein n=1 Tax=Mucilaginibacter sp. TaxID=1882438 RepID=UPI000CA6FC70|nr:nitroreductase family protein [Mucilaginibacter sp.]PLW91558.1 MAG: NAD(P)H-dependent oxidoreductase [Mucilaginibacter sp.]HEK21865.1 NAD(P)H-dependent oxidoreductase [Bacteroidota bacterium]
MSLIDDLKWRYATKKYDPTKKVSQEDVDKIIEAARLAPTSSGLQQFRVLVVSNQDIKEKLAPSSLNPEVMVDCSHVLVFAAWDRYTAERIDTIYDRITDERDLPRGRFGSYTDKIKNLYLNETAEENFVHTSRQSYIAFAMAIAQAAELKVDSTPAEGFNNALVDELLNLKQKGLKSVTLLYLGYRDENDWLASIKKVRNPVEEFVIEYK